jgi:hypothetical protein
VFPRASIDGIIVARIFDVYFPRGYPDNRAIYIVKVIDMPGERAAFDDLEVGLVEASGSC